MSVLSRTSIAAGRDVGRHVWKCQGVCSHQDAGARVRRAVDSPSATLTTWTRPTSWRWRCSRHRQRSSLYKAGRHFPVAPNMSSPVGESSFTSSSFSDWTELGEFPYQRVPLPVFRAVLGSHAAELRLLACSSLLLLFLRVAPGGPHLAKHGALSLPPGPRGPAREPFPELLPAKS